MNRIYRLVFNRALGQVQAVSEVASRRHGTGSAGAAAAGPAKAAVCAALCAALLAVAGQAAAQAPGAQDLPTGWTVVGGDASVTAGAGTMEIVQNGRAVIDWNTFDIGSDASVRFTQSGGSVALNRILDSNASQILGKLDADATIFLINPNGILFGAGAEVNVGGLLASTMSPVAESYPGAPDPIDDFLQGGFSLNLAASAGASAAIVNRGTLRGGQIALAGGYVENAAGATIEADGGRVDLVGAEGVALTLQGASFSVMIRQPARTSSEATLVNNQGLIRATGGNVTLSARANPGAVGTVVNTEGVIEASGIVLSGDGAQLRAGGDIAASGSLNLSSSDNQAYLDGDIEAGSLAVQARSIRQAGGTLEVTGPTELTASYWDFSGERFGDIVLDGDGNAFVGTVDIAGQNVTLDSTTDLRFGALRADGDLTVGGQGAVAFAGGTVGGALDVEAAGAITQTAALTVRGTAALDAGAHAIALNHAGNDFVGAVEATGAGIALADANALTIGSLSNASDRALSLAAGTDLVLPAAAIDTGSAALTLSAGGTLATQGALHGGVVELHGGTALNLGHDVGGDTSVALSSDGAIVQDAAATIDTAALTVDADSASLLGQNAVDALGDVRTSGDFRLRNAQAIAQAADATVEVGGAAEFDAGAADIVLDAAGNGFGGEVALRGGELTLVASGLLRMGELASGADAGVRLSAGQIDLSGLGAIDTGAGALELEALDGTLATGGTLRGGSVRLSAADGLLLGHDVTAGQGLALDSGGAIVQQAGVLSAPRLDVDGAGVVVLDGANRLGALGDIETQGAFTLVNAQAIVQAADGTFDIGGTSSFDAGGARIALDRAGNQFGGSVGLRGGEVSIQGAGTLTLAAVEAASLEASASTIRLSTGIATEGDQTYRGSVSLVADTTLASEQGDIAFEGAVGGAYRLTANAGGDASFGGGVSVRSLTVDAATFGAAGALSTTEALDIAARAGGIGQDAAWTVGGTASLSGATGIDLRHADNDFRGAVNLGGGDAAIHDRDALTLGTLATGALTASSGGALDLGGGTVDGALVATSAQGGIGQSGALTVTGTSTLDAGTGAIALEQAGNDFVGSVAASGAGIALRDANDLAIGGLTGAADRAIALTAGGALSLPAVAIDTGNAALTLSSGGTLTTAASLAGSEVRLHSDSELRLDHAVTGRSLLALSSGGSIYGSAAPIATALLTVDAQSALLGNRDNAIDALGDVTLQGGLTLANARAIRQAADATLTVAGMSTFDAGTHAIDLQNEGNALAGPVNLSGGATTIRQAGDLTLGSVSTDALTVSSGGALGLGQGSVRGALVATSATGGIGQSGALTVAGTATLDAGSDAIALAQADNDFRGAVDLAGGIVEIRDRDALTLGDLDTGALTAASGGALDLGSGTIDGGLVATSATGGIGQSGALTVVGTATLDAGSDAITLAQVDNDFRGVVSLAGGTVEIRDRDALTLGQLDTGALTATSGGALDLGRGTVDGALVATSAAGGIGQSGALTVTGAATLDAGGDAIALTQADNDFRSAVSLAGGAVQIRDRDALTLGELDTGAMTATSGGALDLGRGTVDGALVATSAAGGIGQSGALEVAGTGTFDAGTGVIDLGQAGNRFAGALALTAGGGVTVRDRGDLTISGLSAGANAGVHLEAGGRLALPAQALDTGDGALTLISGQLLETAAALSGGAVTLRGGQGVALGHDVTARDTLVLSSASGAIAQSAGRVAATGHATVDAAQGVSLQQAGNDFGTIAVLGTDVRLRDADEIRLTGVGATDLHVQAQTIRLDLDAVSTSGDQTYAGRVALDRNATLASSGGDLAFQAVDGGAYGLTARAAQGSVDFDGAVALRALDVAAATFRAGGTLATTERLAIATTGGGIGQNGAWTVGGTADLSASGDIALRDDGNDFARAVTLSAGGDVAVYDANALTVAALASGAGADVHLEAGGRLTLPAHAIDTGVGDLTLVSGGQLGTTGALSGNAVTLRSAETLSLRHDVDAASLELTSAGGDIMQSGGRVAVSGHTEARAAHRIDLWRGGDNDFATLGVAGSDVRVRDVDELRLTGVQARSLNVQAQTIRLDVDVETSGSQVYDGRLALDRDTALTSASGNLRFQAVDGAHGLTARALAGSIDFAGAVAVDALDTASIWFNAGSALSTADTLGIRTTWGGIEQSAAWTVGGTTTLDSAAGIDLADAGNDFGQAVYLSANGLAGATLVDRNDLTMAAVSLRPNARLVLRALGRLTLPDQAIDTGTGELALLAGDTLSTTAALSGGAVTLSGDRGIVLGHDVTARSFLSLWSRDGAIAQTGGRVSASGFSSAVAAQGVSLDREGNDFDALSVSGTQVRLRDDNAVRLTGVGATDLHVQAQTIRLDLDAVITSGDQTYAGRVALDRDVRLTSTGGDLAFQAVDGGAYGLTARAAQGGVDFDGAVAVRELDVEAATFRAGDTLATTERLAIAATGGGIGQHGAWTVGGTADLSASGDIALHDDGNDFFGPVSLEAGEGVALHDANDLTVASLSAGAGHGVHLEAGGALTLPGQAIDTGDGALTLVSGGTLSTTGALAGGAVTLQGGDGVRLGHDVTARDTLALSSARGDVAQDGGRLVAVGATTVEAGGSIGLQGANDFRQALALSAGGEVRVRDVDDLQVASLSSGADRDVHLEAGGALTLPGQAIDTGNGALTLVSGTTLATAGALSGGAVELRGGDGVTLAHDVSAGAHLTLSSARGDVAQTAGRILAGAATTVAAGGDIRLAGEGNDFAGAVQLRGGEATIRDANALTLGTIDVAALTATAGDALDLGTGRIGGTLSGTSERGGIGQSGALSVGGDVALDAAGDVTLLADNAFAGTVDVRGRAVSLRSDTLRLDDVQADSLLARGARIELGQDIATRGAQTYEGALALTADRALSSAESDLRFAGTVAGAHALTADAGGAATFADAIDVAALSVDANAFSAASTLVAQDLRIAVAAGGIGQSAAWRVGTASMDAGAGDIALDRADNDFGTAHLRGGETTIRDANALALGTIDVAALTATAGDALDLGAGRVGGSLTATSERGGIGQSGALAVGGDLALDAAGDVTLLAGNAFAGTVDVRGRAVSLHSDTLRLDDVQADSLLARGDRIELGRDIATRGAQAYEGALALTADRALSSAESDLRFAGTVDGAHALTATAAGTVAFDGTVGGATALATLTVDGGRVALASGLGVAGDLTIRAGRGGIVQAGGTAAGTGVGDGAWHVGGATRLEAGSEAIVATHAGNDFAGAVHLRGGEATIRDANALTLGTIDVAALTATAGDALDLGTGRIGGTLTASSERGGIGQSGALGVGGDVALDAAGDVTLLADNAFAGTVDVRGQTVSLLSDTLRLGAVQADSLLARGARIELGQDIATRGAQAYEGALALGADRALSSAESDLRFAGTVDGAHALSADAGGSVTFADAIDVAALSVDANAFSAASTLVAQDLRIAVAEGGIGQSAAWRVGTATLDAGAGDIALDRADNDFGTVRLRGGAVAVRDANDLAVAALASGPDRDVSLVAGGTLSLPAQAIDTGTGALTLASQGGALATAGVLAGGDVTLTGRDGLALGHDVDARGALVLAARDAAIAQTGGRIVAAGRTTVDAGEGEATLAQAGNDFAGPVDLTAAAASIRDANALSLGAVDVAGALTVATAGELGLGAGRIGGALSASSGGGAIGQSGALSVGGDAALDADGGAIALDDAGNDFAGTVHLAGGAVSIRDANALALGTLSVAGLQVASGGALSLGQGRIGGDLDARAGGAIGQSGALAVAGASRIDAGDGDIVLDQAGNDFGGAVSLAGGAMSVRDANDLAVAGLASGADRDVSLVAGGTLSLPVQAIDTGAGALRLASLGGRLDTAGALRGAEVSLAGAGGLGLGHDVEADGTLSLSSGGDIVQTGGALAAATLTGASAGATRLDGANRIGTLGAYAAQGLSLSVAGPLRIAGPVEGGASAALSVAGDLALDGRLAATDVRLQAGGGIIGGADGAIVAHTLSGQAGGAVMLGEAGRYMDNQVDLLGDFVARAGFSLTNGRSLTLASLGGSAFTVDAGTAATYLWVDGDLLQSGEAFLHNGAGTWAATGRIGLQDAPIRVVGVDPQWVEAIGQPPAYFYALRADGSLLPVIGASAVNVPASIWAGRAQSASRRDVGYVDVGADASNYRPYGVVGPGIRLPEDQQPECDPDFPTPECAQVQ